MRACCITVVNQFSHQPQYAAGIDNPGNELMLSELAGQDDNKHRSQASDAMDA